MPDDPSRPDPSARHRPPVFWRAFKSLGFGLPCLAVLALLVCLFENWRGTRAWNQLKADYEAKGEKLDYRAFIPPPAADADNFATTPLMSALLDYDRSPGVTWRNPEMKKRAEAVSGAFSNSREKKSPRPGSWQINEPVPLDEWQEYFVGHTNHPDAARSENPAQGVLRALQKFDPELAELESASLRPRSVFPVHYEDNFNALLPHLATIKGINGVVRLRTLARLKAGRKDEALRDLQFTLRLAESVREEPFLISQLVRISMLQGAIQPVWEGCMRHEWTSEQLTMLQDHLASIQLLKDYGRVMRSERAFGNAALDLMRTGKLRLTDLGGPEVGSSSGPIDHLRPLIGGWWRQNQIVINRLHQERTIPLIDATKHRVFVPQARESENIPELQSAHIYNVLARLLLPAVMKTATKFAHAQTALDLATVACALERHRLATGEYPAQLDLLVPKFIEKLPADIINGEMLKYRREADGSFALWSVGWNETDDQGEAGLNKTGKSHDITQGDWVWRFTPDR